MEKTIALSDRVTEAAGLAEAISFIAFCMKSTGASFEDKRIAPAVFLGIEKLSYVLSDELMDIADDIYETEKATDGKAKS